jgi:hypothetical protein
MLYLLVSGQEDKTGGNARADRPDNVLPTAAMH